jgi:hypothetical protein
MNLGKKEFAEIISKLAVLATQNDEIKADLREHIRRTTNLEGRTESIEKHVHMVQGILKFLAFTGAGLVGLSTIGGVIVSYWLTKG